MTTTDQLMALLQKEQCCLVDVRTPAEVNEVAVEGADNIPMDEVPQKVERFRQMEGPIVVFCRSGARSGSVEAFLRSHGVEQVYNGGGYPHVIQTLNKVKNGT